MTTDPTKPDHATPMAKTAGTGRDGLSSDEARVRLARYGPNSVATEASPSLLWAFGRRFWGPIPSLLETCMAVQFLLGEQIEAAVIGVLLVINALLGVGQEHRAQRALLLMRKQLQVAARVRRDGEWRTLPAETLVPDDVVHVRMGRIVPADLRLAEGELQVDQSALTGESSTIPLKPGGTAYAGSLAVGGEAVGLVIATGSRTYYGRSAELVRLARLPSRQETEILSVVRTLFGLNILLAASVVGFGRSKGLDLIGLLPLLLTMLLASIPVALPATFTLAAAFGALELSRRGGLVTRLSAIHDLASMTVLCVDKTGTLTSNEAVVTSLLPAVGVTERSLLEAAVSASSPAGQATLDSAVLHSAAAASVRAVDGELAEFIPFDPATKRSEAFYRIGGVTHRFVKGAPSAVGPLCGLAPEDWKPFEASLAAQGQRTLAVAAGEPAALKFLGVIGVSDGVRADSPDVVEALRAAGVRLVLATGDNALAARRVAEEVGISGEVWTPPGPDADISAEVLGNSVFAGVYPEHKFRLVQAFQAAGAVVGMSGDGVNDAPALRQAEAGVAVANAVDIAKAAAAIVLTKPGLGGLVDAIEVSRRVFQRMLAYTLNMLAKKIETMLVLAAGFFVTGHKPLTPMLMVVVIFLNDFVTMALTTDRMSVPAAPVRWNTRDVVIVGGFVGVLKFCFSFGVLLYAHAMLGFDTPHIQSITFLALVLSSQAGTYLLRERRRCWDSRPGWMLLLSTGAAVAVSVLLVLAGFQVAPLDPPLVLVVGVLCAVYFIVLDSVKAPLLGRLTPRGCMTKSL